MPSDLQTIDAFERLRELFLRENPGFDAHAATRAAAPGTEPEEQVVEAWLQAIAGREASPGAPQRRLRGLTRAVVDAGRALEDFDPDDRPLIERGRTFTGQLSEARRAGLAPLAEPAGGRVIGEEIPIWQRIIPGLAGMRVWRFLEMLGRPVAVPDAGIRRTLWRLGLTETAKGGDPSLLAAHDALVQISKLTGLEIKVVGTLGRWVAVSDNGWKGGGWCGALPRCGECPLGTACAWARLHPAGEAEVFPVATQPSMGDPLRRQVTEGGQQQLTEAELIALVLPGKVAGVTAMELADSLLRRFGGLRGIERASVVELARLRGISTSRAVQIKAALELGRRLATHAFQPGDAIRSSEDVWRAYRTRFRNLPQEHFAILLLDAKNRVMRDQIVSKGTLTGSLAHPREVFQQAVRESAAGVILLHNHPSGDPAPSQDDRDVTNRLREAGEILGIRVLDHIILGADDYFSFKDEE